MEVPATEIPASQLLTEEITNIIPYLDKYGVCVVPLKNISTGTRNRYLLRTNFYQNANQILKEENQIKELTLREKIHPETINHVRLQTQAKAGSTSMVCLYTI